MYIVNTCIRVCHGYAVYMVMQTTMPLLGVTNGHLTLQPPVSHIFGFSFFISTLSTTF